MSLLSRVLHPHSEKAPRSRSKSVSSPKRSSQGVQKRVKSTISLHIKLESPPIVLYGHAHESTGSLVSGILTLEVSSRGTSSNGLSPQTSASLLSPQISETMLSPQRSGPLLSPQVSAPVHMTSGAVGSEPASDMSNVVVDSVVLRLVQTVHYTKPFLPHSSQIGACKNCSTRKTTLAQWDVLSQCAGFPVGEHAYPFSHLLPGSLAASSKLGSAHSYSFIKYDLVAVATRGSRENVATLPVNVTRSILRGPDRNSLRVFPPTEVTASAVLPGVMYPKSAFPIELRMGHVVNEHQDRRWRMRKLSWKLEEHTQVAAYACPEHAPKLAAMHDSQKRAQLAKKRRTTPGSASSRISTDGPSKSNGMHHSTIQTSSFVSTPPVDPHVAVRAVGLRPVGSNPAAEPELPPGNHDLIEPEEEVPTNRVTDEAVHFEEDFGVTNAPPPTSAPPPIDAPTPTLTAVSSAPSTPNPTNSSVGFEQNQGNDAATAKEYLFQDELRVVAHGDIKSGWKSDFSGEGAIELVAEIDALQCSSGLKRHAMYASSNNAQPDALHEGLRNDANVSCDIADPVLGIYVGHVLVLEVIVAEEIVSQGKPSQHSKDGLTPVSSTASTASASASPTTATPPVGVPTGSARVLRMQFKVILTERSGLGIAWDDEVPPMYEDVRAMSPPTYTCVPHGTPNSLLGLSPALGSQRPAPKILYGLGSTPVVGAFGPGANLGSIDAMADLDENVQEFRL